MQNPIWSSAERSLNRSSSPFLTCHDHDHGHRKHLWFSRCGCLCFYTKFSKRNCRENSDMIFRQLSVVRQTCCSKCYDCLCDYEINWKRCRICISGCTMNYVLQYIILNLKKCFWRVYFEFCLFICWIWNLDQVSLSLEKSTVEWMKEKVPCLTGVPNRITFLIRKSNLTFLGVVHVSVKRIIRGVMATSIHIFWHLGCQHF